MLCAIQYHLYSLKNVKNTHGGLLLLVRLQAACNFTKSNTPLRVFFAFFKSYKWYQSCNVSQIYWSLTTTFRDRMFASWSYYCNLKEIIQKSKIESSLRETQLKVLIIKRIDLQAMINNDSNATDIAPMIIGNSKLVFVRCNFCKWFIYSLYLAAVQYLISRKIITILKSAQGDSESLKLYSSS